MYSDQLLDLYKIHGYHPEDISRIVAGENYYSILLNNGNIGVAATLKTNIGEDFATFKVPDFNNFTHRAVLTAYLNAKLNYDNVYEKEVDIFEEFQFQGYKKLVMVGLFESLYKNLKSTGIDVQVFDNGSTDERTLPKEKQSDIMKNADAAIITSTSIINGTFGKLISTLPPTCDIYMLGPSGTLTNDIFKYPNVKYVFGSVFDNNNELVLNAIEAGAGTHGFLKWLHKVFIKNPNSK
jgi:uncharacterized protein (DUF4213/DUF364 family)